MCLLGTMRSVIWHPSLWGITEWTLQSRVRPSNRQVHLSVISINIKGETTSMINLPKGMHLWRKTKLDHKLTPVVWLRDMERKRSKYIFSKCIFWLKLPNHPDWSWRNQSFKLWNIVFNIKKLNIIYVFLCRELTFHIHNVWNDLLWSRKQEGPPYWQKKITSSAFSPHTECSHNYVFLFDICKITKRKLGE